MPILIKCDCGKTLKLSDAKAGLRCRCPGCMKIHDIPKPAAEPQAATAPPARPEPRPIGRDEGPPAPPPAEDLICPKCGNIESAGAHTCQQCGHSFRAGSHVLATTKSSSLLDAAPVRWLIDHKLLLVGVVALGFAFFTWRACRSPGSPAYDHYHAFADLVAAGEYGKAHEMVEGEAVEQLERVQREEGFGKQVVTSRTMYTLTSETFSDGGNTSTIRLTQKYWSTAPGSLQTTQEPMERDHTAKVVRRNGKWVVVSFEMGSPRKAGEAAGVAKATTIIRVDAASCGVSAERPLGTFKLADRIMDAGLTRKPPEEQNEGGEVVQVRAFTYELRAKEGGSWPESLAVHCDIDGEVRAVRAEFRMSGAPGTPLEESRVARFATDYWTLVLGAAPALDAKGHARAERGEIAAEWRKEPSETREFVEFRSKKASKHDESLWPQSSRSHTGRVTAVGVFPPTGERFTTGEDGYAITYRHSGYEEKLGHAGPVTSAASSSDGAWLVTGCADGKVRLWKRDGVDVKFQVMAEWLAHAGGVNDVALSSGGDIVASAGEDKAVKLWSFTSHAALATLTGHTSAVTKVAFRPDGTGVASAGRDGTVRLWDLKGAAQGSFQAHTGGVLAICFDPDGKQLASGGADGAVKLWNLRSGTEVATLKGHEGAVQALAYTHGGRVLVSGGADRALRFWSTATRDAFKVLRCFAGLTCLVSVREGSITAGGDDGLIRTWSFWNLEIPKGRAAARGEAEPATRTLKLETFPTVEGGILLSSNGRTLTVAMRGSDAIIWDPATGKRRAVARTGGVFSVALSHDGAYVASGMSDFAIRIHDTQTGKEMPGAKGLKMPGAAVAVSRDGKRAASENSTGRSRIQVWDIEGGKLLSEFDGRGGTEITRMDFSPDGRILVASSEDGAIQVFDAASGKRLRDLTGHEGAVICVSFSDDGALLASGGADGSVRLWRVSDGAQIDSYRDHASAVYSVALSPNGKRLVSAGAEVFVREVGSDADPRFLGKGAHAGAAGFTADGAGVLYVDGAKGEIRIWDRK